MTRLILRLASLPASEPLTSLPDDRAAAHGADGDSASATAPATAPAGSPQPDAAAARPSTGPAVSVTTVVSATNGNGHSTNATYEHPLLVPPRVIELSRHEQERQQNGAAGSLPAHADGNGSGFAAEHLDAAVIGTDSLNGWMAATVGSADGALVVDDRGRVAALSEPAARLLDCGPDVIGRLLTEAVNVVDLDTGASVPVYSPGIPALDVLVTGGIRRSLMRIRRFDDALTSLDVCSVSVHGVDGAVVGSMSFLESVSG